MRRFPKFTPNFVLGMALALSVAGMPSRALAGGGPPSCAGDAACLRKWIVPCTVALAGIVGLGAAGLAYFMSGTDDDKKTDEQPSEVAQKHDTPVEGKTKGKPLFEGNQEVVLGCDGEIPCAFFFDNNSTQRAIAKLINDRVMAEESREDLRAKLHKGESLRASIEGLVLRPRKDDPNQIEVVVIGAARELPLRGTVDRQKLEDGTAQELALPLMGSRLGVLTAKGKGAIRFRYDRKDGAVVVESFAVDFEVAPLVGKTHTDGAKLLDVRLIPKDVVRRPPTEAKLFLDEKPQK